MAMSRVRHVCPRTSGTPQLCHSHHPHLAVSLWRARASTDRAGTWPSSHRTGCKSSGKEKENVCRCQVRRGHRPARAPAPHRHQAPWARHGRGSPPGRWAVGGLCCKVGAPISLPGWSRVKNDVSETATATSAGTSPAGRLQALQARASRPSAPHTRCSGTLKPCTNLCLPAAGTAVGHEQKSPKSLSCSCAAKSAREPQPLLHTRALPAVAGSAGRPPARERPQPPAPPAWPPASQHRSRPGARPRLIILSSLAALPPHKPSCQALT